MKRNLARVACGLILAACTAVVAERPHPWETGTVISQKLTPDSSTVVVFVGGYSYVWQEFTHSPDWDHFIVLVHDQPVHDSVRFYRDGQWFVVLDGQGTIHRFRLVRAAKFD